MSWTYSGDPTTSPMDEVRFLIGDTNVSLQELQDEEINYTITNVSGASTSPPAPATGNYLAAAYCADALMAKYATLVDKSVGDLRLSYNQRYRNFQALAAKLRMRANLLNVKVYAGGQSVSEKIGIDNDPDRVQPAVKIDGMDYVSSNADNESSQTTVP